MPINPDIAATRIGDPVPGLVSVATRQLGGMTVFDRETIPLDGRVYRCDGQVVYSGGTAVRAKFTLDTSCHPVLAQRVLCHLDGIWFDYDESTLLQRLGLGPDAADSAVCIPDRGTESVTDHFQIAPDASARVPITPLKSIG